MRLFTADLHFWHKNIQKYCPGRMKIWGNNIEKMNAGLIERWNKKVGQDDDIYILGDFAFCNREKMTAILAQLNGRKHLILGNHDEETWATYIRCGFYSVQRYLSLNIHGGPVMLVHDPSNCIMDSSAIWLSGHLHQQFVLMNNCINVGADIHDFTPVSEEELEPFFEIVKKNMARKDQFTAKEFIAEWKRQNGHE